MIILFSVITFSVRSQTKFQLSPDTASLTVDVSGLAALVYIWVHNLTPDTLNLQWQRLNESIPAEWDDCTVCDEWTCHLPTTMTYPFYILPNDSGPVVAHFKHKQIIGEGTMEINIYDPADSLNENITAVYYTIVTEVSGINENEVQQVRLYPNPGTGFFRLESTKVLSNRIAIHNILGQGIESIDIPNGAKQIDLSLGHLNPGLYFVHFNTIAGPETIRLIKY